jgi:NADPH-dependent curcumin reductase CurA
LKRRPQGALSVEDFEYREEDIPNGELNPGEILVRNVAFLCAPTMRNWMDEAGKNLHPTNGLGQPVTALSVGRVVDSANPELPVGARVSLISSWQDYTLVSGTILRPPTILPDGINYTDAMGRFGVNPIAAYFGLLEVGQPKEGETLVVSGAAGSTGSTAAQIGKLKGLRVIGIAGGKAKCDWLTNDCGIDAAIDYKSEDVAARLTELCPVGIDIYYDNVGGDILQAAVDNMAKFGRIVLCGQISSYDSGESPEGPRNMMRLIYGGIRMQGFVASHYVERFPEAIAQLRAWADEDQIVYREDLRTGFENLPSSFLSLFDGTNAGTLIVQVEVS